jgi:hypothetical protein
VYTELLSSIKKTRPDFSERVFGEQQLNQLINYWVDDAAI